MDLKRFLRHLLTDQWSARRAFPRAAMRAIRDKISEQEKRHVGELRFAVEASLSVLHLWHGQDARGRAIELFGQLRVWDTEHNSGVLIYLLLADRRVEIVADRGIHAKVGEAAWAAICAGMQGAFEQRKFEQGVTAGLVAISDLLTAHYPAFEDRPNELSNEPVVL